MSQGKGKKGKRNNRFSQLERENEIKEEKIINGHINSHTNGHANDRTNMSKILSKMAEWNLSKDEDELSKEFLVECKRVSDSLILDPIEMETSLLELRNQLILLPSNDKDNLSNPILTFSSSHDTIKQLFHNKLSLNTELRRNFMEIMSEWKKLLRDRKEQFKDRCQLETDIESQSNVNEQLHSIYVDVTQKSNEVKANTTSLIEAETSCNEELKSKLYKTLEDVGKKLKENDDDMEHKLQENNELKIKLEELKSHFEIQKKHYQHQLQTQSLHSQLYNAKIQQKKEVDLNRKQEIEKYSSKLSHLLSTINEMKQQIQICSVKVVEFEVSIEKSEQIYNKYDEQQQSVEEFIKKLESEIDDFNQVGKELESNLLSTVDKVQKCEEILKIINRQIHLKVNRCRSLQETRNVLQKQSNHGIDMLPVELIRIPEELSSSEKIPIPSSSSSSSSSTRMLREQITLSVGDETAASTSSSVSAMTGASGTRSSSSSSLSSSSSSSSSHRK